MEKKVIIAASCYKMKYFFNDEFSALPDIIKEELKEIAVVLAQKLHCVFTIGFMENSDIYFEATAEENDFDYDDIGAKLEINKLERTEKELINQLSLWYRVFVLGEKINENR